MGSVQPSNQELISGSLFAAQALFTKNHLKSKASHEEACEYMPGGNTRSVLHTQPFPYTVVSADSCYLNTLDGQRYIDFLGEHTAGIFGHNNPVIREAIDKAASNGWNYGAQSLMEKELAKIVCQRFPAIELVRFVNSGTEANMMALATATNFTHRRKILIFEKGYHGSTISGRAAAGKPSVNLPHDFLIGQYNDVEGTKKLLESLPKDSLAAILVEPMLGSGGCYIAKKEFLQMLRDVSTQLGALLIFDEVMTSRLSYHGLSSTFDIKPDLMTLGKWVGGGMTFGAFGGRRDIMEMFDPRKAQLEHPGTFNNNVFTMSAGAAGCKIYSAERVDQLNAVGESMRSRIENVLEKRGLYAGSTVPIAPVTDARVNQADHPQRPPKIWCVGRGSMMMIHFGGPEAQQLSGLFFLHMLEHNINIAQKGFITLSMEIQEEHVDEFMLAFEIFISTFKSALYW